LKKEILCIWRVARRSNLAFGDLQTSVVEVKHWESNLKVAATFYRSSAVRTELKLISEKFYRFPEYFDKKALEFIIY